MRTSDPFYRSRHDPAIIGGVVFFLLALFFTIAAFLRAEVWAAARPISSVQVYRFKKHEKLQIAKDDLYTEISGRAAITPWSGSQYPVYENELLEPAEVDSLSTLRKYARYVETVHPELGFGEREILEWEKINHSYFYTPAFKPFFSWLDWKGHCDGLASASIMVPEPRSPVRRAGIDFSVADLKGLLIESYLETAQVYFGERVFNRRQYGDVEDYARSRDDISPDLLHRLLLYFVKQQRSALVFDFSKGDEVFNHPVYQFAMYMVPRRERGIERTDWVSVTLDVVFSDSTSKEFVGDDSEPNVKGVKTYYYDLRLDPAGTVVEAEWAREREVLPDVERERRSRVRRGETDLSDLRHCERHRFTRECGEKHWQQAPDALDHPDFVWLPYKNINPERDDSRARQNPYVLDEIVEEIVWGKF